MSCICNIVLLFAKKILSLLRGSDGGVLQLTSSNIDAFPGQQATAITVLVIYRLSLLKKDVIRRIKHQIILKTIVIIILLKCQY